MISFEAQNFLAGRALEYLNKGFTVQLNYTIELWKSRGFWFDRPITQQKLEHIITYDIVRREYSVFRKIDKEISEKTIFKIEPLIDWVTKFMEIGISKIKKLQDKSFYYYSINAELKMLTADDLKDLQLWLSGIEDETKSTDKSRSLSSIFIGIVTDFLVSQKSIKLKMESEKFQIQKLTETKR